MTVIISIYIIITISSFCIIIIIKRMTKAEYLTKPTTRNNHTLVKENMYQNYFIYNRKK